MALGGGTWAAQDKILPGTYINFSSAAKAASALSDRGIVIVPLSLSWGPEGKVFELDSATVSATCRALLGYDYSDTHMLPIRELFRNASKVYAYRINTDAAKAANTYATAKYGGLRGNDINLVITANADDPSKYDVATYLVNTLEDRQIVASAADLKDNHLVTFKKDATIAVTAGLALEDGTDGSELSGESYKAFLSAAESYSFNILCCPCSDAEVVSIFVEYTKRMCEENGANFQTVCYKPIGANYEGIIGAENAALGDTPDYSLVYWLAGAEAACQVGASLTNRTYDGELELDLSTTQSGLKKALEDGKLIFHNVNGVPKILKDINTLTTFCDNKNEDFRYNQTIRTLGGIANDIAAAFNEKFLGTVPNNADGRISLWNEICKVINAYEKAGAIEAFDTGKAVVSQGNSKDSVVCALNGIQTINAMSELYMSIVIE